MSPPQIILPGGLSSLEPFRTDGPDSLAPDPSDKIAAARLRKLGTIWHDKHPLKIIAEGDDLFCATACNGPLHPIDARAELTEATIEFSFPDSPDTAVVNIRPPDAISLMDSPQAPRVTRFLAKHHFITVLLALFATICPDFAAEDAELAENRRIQRIASCL